MSGTAGLDGEGEIMHAHMNFHESQQSASCPSVNNIGRAVIYTEISWKVQVEGVVVDPSPAGIIILSAIISQ